MRRWTALLLLAAAACSTDALAPDATDAPEPAFGLLEYGCPDPFFLVNDGGNAADGNGDGFVCVMKFEDGNGGYHLIEIDNNIPANQVGQCPGAFETRFTIRGTDPDRNENGIVCLLTHANGSTTVIDDNHKGTK